MNKYKVGDKIVLTVSDVNEKAYYSYYVFNNNDLILSKQDIDKYAEPLTAYTEPLERKNANKQKQIEKLVDKLHRQAAEITRLLRENKELKNEKQELTRERNQLMGRCGGLSAARIKKFNDGRLAGQNEAWELVRKIFDMETNDIEDIFIKEDAWNLGTVLNNYTYQEAAAKVAEWEKIKEIKVGDILEDRDEGNKVIVTSLKGRVICLLWDDGRIGTTYVELAKGIFRNTGRHIDIDSFLKQIGGENDEK